LTAQAGRAGKTPGGVRRRTPPRGQVLPEPVPTAGARP